MYEDPPPDSSQNSPSPPSSSVGPATAQNTVPDAPIEIDNSANAADLYPHIREKAATVRLPSPVSLKSFRPLLFTDYEDPLLYALSDISLEDMNMSL